MNNAVMKYTSINSNNTPVAIFKGPLTRSRSWSEEICTPHFLSQFAIAISRDELLYFVSRYVCMGVSVDVYGCVRV